MSEIVNEIEEAARRLRARIGEIKNGATIDSQTLTDLTTAATRLEESAIRISRQMDDLERASGNSDRFIANVSHELRTPLTPALLLISALQTDSSLPNNVRSDLAMVREQLDLEARLVDDLLDNSRLTRGRMQLRREPLDLRALLGGIVAGKLAQLGSEPMPALSLDYRARNQRVQGDPARLRQILSNLLDNAYKYTPVGGKIEIIAEDAGERIAIEVRDNGRGFDASQLPGIFEAFDHGREALARNFGGLGLGLAIARGLTQLHGGELTASSPGIGKGATFRVVLPAGADVATATKEERHRLRLLLVEDDAQSRLATGRLLEYRGYIVRTTGSFATAMQILNSESIDVLLCDIQLPDGDGWDLMRCARQVLPTLKGLALSGFGREEDVRRSLEAGYEEHLIKPFTMQALTIAIDRAAGKMPA